MYFFPVDWQEVVKGNTEETLLTFLLLTLTIGNQKAKLIVLSLETEQEIGNLGRLPHLTWNCTKAV